MSITASLKYNLPQNIDNKKIHIQMIEQNLQQKYSKNNNKID